MKSSEKMQKLGAIARREREVMSLQVGAYGLRSGRLLIPSTPESRARIVKECVRAEHPAADSQSSLLLELQKTRGMTLIVATHDPEVAASCQRVVALRDDEIVSDEGLTAG